MFQFQIMLYIEQKKIVNIKYIASTWIDQKAIWIISTPNRGILQNSSYYYYSFIENFHSTNFSYAKIKYKIRDNTIFFPCGNLVKRNWRYCLLSSPCLQHFHPFPFNPFHFTQSITGYRIAFLLSCFWYRVTSLFESTFQEGSSFLRTSYKHP